MRAIESAFNAGSNFYIETRKELELKKRDVPEGTSVVKASRYGVRYGVKFENLASIQAAIEEGTRDDVGPLPWGAWQEGQYNRVIIHKGADYLRLYPASFAGMKHKTQWFLNGAEVQFAAVENYIKADDKPKPHTAPCFGVNVANIVSIGE